MFISAPSPQSPPLRWSLLVRVTGGAFMFISASSPQSPPLRWSLLVRTTGGAFISLSQKFIGMLVVLLAISVALEFCSVRAFSRSKSSLQDYKRPGLHFARGRATKTIHNPSGSRPAAPFKV